MLEIDYSPEAIRRRYDRANELAVVTSDRITFSSVQDVLYLLKKVKELEEKLKDATNDVP